MMHSPLKEFRKPGRRALAAVFSALLLLGTAAHTQPSSLDLDQCRSLLKTGDLAGAETALSAYLAQNPNSADAHYLLAFTLFRENHPRPSLEQFTQAAQLRPPDATSLRCVALDYALLDDYPDAEKWMRVSLEHDSRQFESWYELGRILQTLGRSVQAEQAFQHALILAPHNVKAENNLGLVYEHLNRLDDAKTAYRQAIAWQENSDAAGNSPKPDEQPYLNLAILLTDHGAYAEAAPLLFHAAAIAPHNAKVREQFGRLYAHQEQWDKAAIELKQAQALGLDTASLHILLGQAFRHTGNTEAARQEFARAAALSGTHSGPTQ